MKKLLSLVLALVFCIVIAAPAWAVEIVDSGACGEKLTWTLDNTGRLTISGSGPMEDYEYNAPWGSQTERGQITTVEIDNGVTTIGKMAFLLCENITDVNIPSSVTSIGYAAFGHCNELTNVYIPTGVTEIGGSAFEWCDKLETVNIPATVVTIGSYAFMGCKSLSSVNIPDSVTNIKSEAFAYCSSLVNINVNVNNTEYSSKDGVLFNKSQTVLICCPGGIAGNYTIPSSVTKLDSYAFYGCEKLTNVNIPNSITAIGYYGFAYCKGITSMSIPSSVTSIDSRAFLYCDSLTSINIPVGVNTIATWAFEGCKSLTSVNISSSVVNIEGSPFYNCNNLSRIDVDLNNSEYSSNDGVLYNKTQSKLICFPSGYASSYNIPNNVAAIGNSAFDHCNNLTSVGIPVSVTEIVAFAFHESYNLTDIYYSGTETQWKAINIDDSNEALFSATVHYNSALPATASSSSIIGVTVNGSPVKWSDAVPFIDGNSRTMVPLRAVADALTLDVSWDASAREASFSNGAKTITFPIGNSSARTSDGGVITMDTAAVIVSDRTYAPVRYLAQYFGYSVTWDDTSRTVVIA